MPVFNRAHLVSATLDSIVAQSDSDWEIIAVDDGSTDDTLAVLQTYGAQLGARMRIIEGSHDGPGAARNHGIAAATGRYIAFLDSDDLWFSWTLAFYREQLEQHNYPTFLVGEPLVFQHDFQWQNASQTRPNTSKKVGVFADYLQAELSTDWLSASSFVVRRDALADKEFCSHAINCEDIDFTLQIGAEPGFVKVHHPPTFAYRQHAGGITGCYIRMVRGIEFLIESERSGRYPGGAARRRQRLRVLGRHVRPALLEFIARGYRRRAWRAFGRTIGWHLQLGRVRFLLGFLFYALLPLKRVSRQERVGAAENNSRKDGELGKQ